MVRKDYSRGLHEVCEAINGHYRGTSDGMDDAKLSECVEFLRGRLAAWTNDGARWAEYDDAVRALCAAALAMHERESAR